MAKIFFVGLDGAEKSYRLQTHRPFTLGRDPGNDIILRDPKVSRHHAEIVFERGFFVLHDLASANGTFVNGKRIRVAPLTHGARLRMGNTYGRFSEELPTETEGPPLASADTYDQAVPHTEDLGALDALPASQLVSHTVPNPKIEPPDLKKKSGIALAAHEPVTEPFIPPGRASGPHQAVQPRPSPFSQTRYRFSTGLRAGEVAAVRGDLGQVVLSYRAFASVVGVVATLVTAIVTLAGLAAVVFLLQEGAPLRAAAALALTIIFAFCISLLVPRIDVTLYEEQHPALTLSQRSVFPSSSWSVVSPEGGEIAEIRKSFLSRLGTNRWRILQNDRLIGEAAEDSFAGALVRKVLGKFSRRFETNLTVRVGGLDAGRIIRRPEANGQHDLLELSGDVIDPRVAVALATLVLGREP